MTDKQIIAHYQKMERINLRDLRYLARLKLKIETAIEAQRLGHTDKWNDVQKQIEKIDDNMDCEELAK